MKRALAVLVGAAAMGAGAAMAQGPVEGGVSLLPSGSALADEMHHFHNVILMPIITFICLVVLGLLLWVIVRYNEKANPVPRKFSHNTTIEVLWTVIPVLILLFIALPSFELLYKEGVMPDGKQTVSTGDGARTEFAFANDFQPSRMVRRDSHLQVFVGDRRLKPREDYTVEGLGEAEVLVRLNQAPARGERVAIHGGRSLVGASGFFGFGADNREIALAPSMTLKVSGFQWGWMYSYPDFGDFELTSNPLSREDADEGLYLFDVDNRVVVPVGETIRVTVTARDVLHAWALPNFAIKIDAVPGRINEVWFAPREEGVYFGQCSEICGVRHAYMPIAVEVVSRERFEAWVDSQRQLAGLEPMFDSDIKLAAAEAGAQANQ